MLISFSLMFAANCSTSDTTCTEDDEGNTTCSEDLKAEDWLFFLLMMNYRSPGTGTSTSTSTSTGNTYNIGTLTTTTATSGSSYSFNISVTGTASETLSVYFSDNNIITSSSDVLAGTVSITGASTTATITVPSSIGGGTYYVGLLKSSGYEAAVSSNTVAVSLNTSSAILLTSGAGYTSGTLSGGTDSKIYKFTVAAGGMYRVYWDDSNSGSGSYTRDVMVTAYAADAVTKLREQLSGVTFNQLDSGYSTVRWVAASSAGTYYLKVQCYYSYCSSGTFGIKMLNVSTNLAVGTGYSPNTLVAASDYTWFYTVSVTSGVTYNVKWDDSYEGSTTYKQDIIVRADFADPFTGLTTVFADTDSAYNTAKSFVASKTGIVYLQVTRYGSSTTAPGFAIRVD